MKQLCNIIRRIRDAIERLDGHKCETKDEASRLVEFLRQESSRRESMLVLRAETLKEALGDSEHDQEEKFKIDSLVYSTIKEIEKSGYVCGVKRGSVALPRMPKKKDKPRKAFYEEKMSKRDFRFEFSKDYSLVKDIIHTADKGYKIDLYEGLNDSPIVVEVINQLLDAARNKKSKGWWIHGNKENWRGAFQKGVYRDFYNEQIQRGSRKNGHQGEWRFITNAEFDELSSKGKYFKRKQP